MDIDNRNLLCFEYYINNACTEEYINNNIKNKTVSLLNELLESKKLYEKLDNEFTTKDIRRTKTKIKKLISL